MTQDTSKICDDQSEPDPQDKWVIHGSIAWSGSYRNGSSKNPTSPTHVQLKTEIKVIIFNMNNMIICHQLFWE